ncbi:MAG TPA: D-aminoacyl-tRNA deacylase [Cytophagaceae bacterium]
MIFLIQRVSHAEVRINQEIYSKIGMGLLILVGIGAEDNAEDIEQLCTKSLNLRIFSDEEGKMNLSLKDIDGELLVVSQFTLLANTKKGNRPSYVEAARPELAKPLYHDVVNTLERMLDKKVSTGVFGADMKVLLENDGPVTIYLNSKK